MDKTQFSEQLDKAVLAHSRWKAHLRTAVETQKCDVTPADASSDHVCGFGKWLESEAFSSQLRDSAPYRVIKRLHAEFHQCAGEVLRLVDSGQVSEAKALYEADYLTISAKLVRGLKKWQNEVAG